MKLLIKKIDPLAKAPAYAYPGDAGLDIFTNEEFTLKPGERYLFGTGLQLALPTDTVGLIWDKSGLAVKQGIKVMAGVIDASYRGELKILIINLGARKFKVKKYTKIAQILVQKVENIQVEEVDNLKETIRGEDAFGSTGLN